MPYATKPSSEAARDLDLFLRDAGADEDILARLEVTSRGVEWAEHNPARQGLRIPRITLADLLRPETESTDAA